MFHKKCKEPGCEEMFDGIGVAKYCSKHKSPKNRAKKQVQAPDHSKNVYIKHKFKEDICIEMNCRVCGKPFGTKIEPKQYIYPACCEKCRKKGSNESTIN